MRRNGARLIVPESTFTLATLNVLLFEWFPIVGTPKYLKLIGEYPKVSGDVEDPAHMWSWE
jgi:hypothetical protein